MGIDRRTFLGTVGAAGAGAVLGTSVHASGSSGEPTFVNSGRRDGTVTTTICPYCGVGCGLLVTAKDGKVVHVEGDANHPINQGSMCSKGAALEQVANNKYRLRKVKYRAPGTDRWVEKDWDWAIDKIAANIKKTRDETFLATDEQGRVVNRTEGIAALGGAALDSEECYAWSKLTRALGLCYLEHQARI